MLVRRLVDMATKPIVRVSAVTASAATTVVAAATQVLSRDPASLLAAARERHAALVSRQAELAEASINDPAAERAYFEIGTEQREVLAEIERLELAAAHAERRTAAEAKERAAGERAAKRAEVGRLLDERLAPAQQLAQAIA